MHRAMTCSNKHAPVAINIHRAASILSNCTLITHSKNTMLMNVGYESELIYVIIRLVDFHGIFISDND
jgi:hypothetical protein